MIPLKITKHGRERWHERVGIMTDKEIEFAIMLPPSHIIPIIELKNTKEGWIKCLITVLCTSSHSG